MRTRRSPRNQESMLHIVSGIKDKQALIMNNSKQRERIAELEAQIAAMRPVVDAAIAYVNSASQGDQYYALRGAIEAYQREVKA